jgi:hypothetical protein
LREGHAGKDWRTCKTCVANKDIDPPDILWRGLNPYNFYPMLELNVPKHNLCETCQVCNKKYISGFEGFARIVKRGVHLMACLDCRDQGDRGYPTQLISGIYTDRSKLAKPEAAFHMESVDVECNESDLAATINNLIGRFGKK